MVESENKDAVLMSSGEIGTGSVAAMEAMKKAAETEPGLMVLGDEGKEEILVVSDDASATEAIKEALKHNMPDLNMEGDLTIKTREELAEEANDLQEERKIIELTPLPERGKTFMLDGHEYKVTFINEGKRRFSCVPVGDVYKRIEREVQKDE